MDEERTINSGCDGCAYETNEQECCHCSRAYSDCYEKAGVKPEKKDPFAPRKYKPGVYIRYERTAR